MTFGHPGLITYLMKDDICLQLVLDEIFGCLDLMACSLLEMTFGHPGLVTYSYER